MYVAVTGSGKYRVIQFREDVRLPGTTKKKINVIKTIGNYERILAEDPDAMEKLRAEAKRITEEKKSSNAPISLEVSAEELLQASDVTRSYYFGHAIVLQLWDRMKLDKFFLDQAGKRDAQKVIEAIFHLLLHRCADPRIILACAKDQWLYAGLYEMKLDRMYDVLDVLESSRECFLALSMMRYAQHLLIENNGKSTSAARLMEALHEPLALVQGNYPNIIVTPTRVSETYLELAKMLGMKPLRKNMTLTQFRSTTKLDLTINLK